MDPKSLIEMLQIVCTGSEMLRVRVRASTSRKGGREYKTLYVVIPSDIAKLLGIEEGDELYLEVTEIEIDGERKKALIYYKP